MVRRVYSIVGLVAVLAAVLAASASPAAARGRQVPRGFFGVVLNPQVIYPNGRLIDASVLDATAANMAHNGVESVRATIDWSVNQPTANTFDWTATDLLVKTLARHGLALLANVLATPQWASVNPRAFNSQFYGPRDPNAFAGFLRAMIARYGPSGNFWALNPGLPKMPVLNWQIWNEQAAPFFWVNQPWPRTYTALLKAAYRTIHGAERGATVIAGSLVGLGASPGHAGVTPWDELRSLYRAGAKPYFDQISVHPFTIDPNSVANSVTRVVTILDFVRAEMRRAHDLRKSLTITELAWPAALGRVAKSRLLGLETTARGEAARLSAAYARLAKLRGRLNLRTAYWFTWASFFNPHDPLSDVSYDFSGLYQFKPPATFVPQLALSAYAKSARALEGCRKGTSALRPC